MGTAPLSTAATIWSRRTFNPDALAADSRSAQPPAAWGEAMDVPLKTFFPSS